MGFFSSGKKTEGKGGDNIFGSAQALEDQADRWEREQADADERVARHPNRYVADPQAKAARLRDIADNRRRAARIRAGKSFFGE